MSTTNIFPKWLYTSIVLIIFSVLIFLFWVIPHIRSLVPDSETAVVVTWVISIIYLLICVGLFWSIRLDSHKKPINKELLVGSAVALIIIDLSVFDGASIYWGSGKETHIISIALFIIIGCTLIASTIIFIARYSKKEKLK